MWISGKLTQLPWFLASTSGQQEHPRIKWGETCKVYSWSLTHAAVVQSLSHVWLFAIPGTIAGQAPLSFTLSPRLCSNACLLSWWCYLTISASSPFAFNLSQHQGLFQCWRFTSGGQNTGDSALASVLSMNIQSWFPWGWIDSFDLLAVQGTLKSPL